MSASLLSEANPLRVQGRARTRVDIDDNVGVRANRELGKEDVACHRVVFGLVAAFEPLDINEILLVPERSQFEDIELDVASPHMYTRGERCHTHQ